MDFGFAEDTRNIFEKDVCRSLTRTCYAEKHTHIIKNMKNEFAEEKKKEQCLD